MKSLSELVAGLPLAVDVPPLARRERGMGGEALCPGGEAHIHAITTDSRRVTPGSLFVAISGYQTDGHRFIADACANGAAAVVYQDEAATIPSGVTAIRVADSRRAAAIIADRFYDHPSGKLTIAAITGTSGKTTTTLLVDSIFRAAGYKTGVIGTLGGRIGDRDLPGDRTTPDSIELQELFAQMLAEGVTHVAMEVSSHALYLDRTWMTAFDAAVFTNLSQDHLDFHADLDEYLDAKLVLFTEYADLARPEKALVGAVNVDDPASKKILASARCECLTFGLSPDAQVRAEDVTPHPSGLSFRLTRGTQAAEVALQLSGAFNAHNALAAATCAYGLGLATETIVRGLEGLAAVPGRFERVDAGQDFTVVVDYAHKPDALEKVIRAARALEPRRVICIIGCGGDRDRDKRPKMGRIATRDADFTIFTADNSRSEEPEAILAQIVAGAQPGAEYVVEPDRRTAIFAGIAMCQPGDILLICGKGHEPYQIFKDRTIHFDDREVAREALVGRGLVPRP